MGKNPARDGISRAMMGYVSEPERRLVLELIDEYYPESNPIDSINWQDPKYALASGPVESMPGCLECVAYPVCRHREERKSPHCNAVHVRTRARLGG